VALTLTPAAATYVADFLSNRGKGEGIRVALKHQAVQAWPMCLSLLMVR
jgi:Fe-S cluster assembly iron-binding protein IscA